MQLPTVGAGRLWYFLHRQKQKYCQSRSPSLFSGSISRHFGCFFLFCFVCLPNFYLLDPKDPLISFCGIPSFPLWEWVTSPFPAWDSQELGPWSELSHSDSVLWASDKGTQGCVGRPLSSWAALSQGQPSCASITRCFRVPGWPAWPLASGPALPSHPLRQKQPSVLAATRSTWRKKRFG
jgi:hypothetical protein